MTLVLLVVWMVDKNRATKSSQTARVSKGVSGAERLSSLQDAGAAVFELDVTVSESELDEKVRELWSIFGRVDVLVNNAGYLEAGIVEASK